MGVAGLVSLRNALSRLPCTGICDDQSDIGAMIRSLEPALVSHPDLVAMPLDRSAGRTFIPVSGSAYMSLEDACSVFTWLLTADYTAYFWWCGFTGIEPRDAPSASAVRSNAAVKRVLSLFPPSVLSRLQAHVKGLDSCTDGTHMLQRILHGTVTLDEEVLGETARAASPTGGAPAWLNMQATATLCAFSFVTWLHSEEGLPWDCSPHSEGLWYWFKKALVAYDGSGSSVAEPLVVSKAMTNLGSIRDFARLVLVHLSNDSTYTGDPGKRKDCLSAVKAKSKLEKRTLDFLRDLFHKTAEAGSLLCGIYPGACGRSDSHEFSGVVQWTRTTTSWLRCEEAATAMVSSGFPQGDVRRLMRCDSDAAHLLVHNARAVDVRFAVRSSLRASGLKSSDFDVRSVHGGKNVLVSGSRRLLPLLPELLRLHVSLAAQSEWAIADMVADKSQETPAERITQPWSGSGGDEVHMLGASAGPALCRYSSASAAAHFNDVVTRKTGEWKQAAAALMGQAVSRSHNPVDAARMGALVDYVLACTDAAPLAKGGWSGAAKKCVAAALCVSRERAGLRLSDEAKNGIGAKLGELHSIRAYSNTANPNVDVAVEACEAVLSGGYPVLCRLLLEDKNPMGFSLAVLCTHSSLAVSPNEEDLIRSNCEHVWSKITCMHGFSHKHSVAAMVAMFYLLERAARKGCSLPAACYTGHESLPCSGVPDTELSTGPSVLVPYLMPTCADVSLECMEAMRYSPLDTDKLVDSNAKAQATEQQALKSPHHQRINASKRRKRQHSSDRDTGSDSTGAPETATVRTQELCLDLNPDLEDGDEAGVGLFNAYVEAQGFQ